LGDQIEAVVGNGSEFGLHVTYSLDGPKLLGTGGALRQALPLLGEYFFVLYGDSFLPVDFGSVQQAFVASRCLALMTVLRNGDRWDKSNVLFLNGKLVEYNKHA
jgi:NDP-sugar pyrophosphorylase family protein